MKRFAFTIIELIFVIIIISLLYYFGSSFINQDKDKFNIGYNNIKLNLLEYKKISNIFNNYKIVKEENNSEDDIKYWFKKYPYFVFEGKKGYLYCYLLKDKSPFNLKYDSLEEIYKQNKIYYIGVSKKEINEDKYPDNSSNIKKTFNLSNYGITKIDFYINNKLETTIKPNSNKNIKILYFNNNLFVISKDSSSKFVLNNERKIIKKSLKIIFYDKKENKKEIKLNPFFQIIN